MRTRTLTRRQKQNRTSRQKAILRRHVFNAYKLHETYGQPISVVKFLPNRHYRYIITEFEGKYRLRHRRMRVYYRTGEGE